MPMIEQYRYLALCFFVPLKKHLVLHNKEKIELLILLIICPSGCRKKVKWRARRANLFKIDVEL